MELAKVELEAIEKAAAFAVTQDVLELNDLQLSLIGGGTGDIHLG